MHYIKILKRDTHTEVQPSSQVEVDYNTLEQLHTLLTTGDYIIPFNTLDRLEEFLVSDNKLDILDLNLYGKFDDLVAKVVSVSRHSDSCKVRGVTIEIDEESSTQYLKGPFSHKVTNKLDILKPKEKNFLIMSGYVNENTGKLKLVEITDVIIGGVL